MERWKKTTLTVPRSLFGPETRLLIDIVTHAVCNIHEKIEYKDRYNTFCDDFLREKGQLPVESCPGGQSHEEETVGGKRDVFLYLSRSHPKEAVILLLQQYTVEGIILRFFRQVL